MPLSNTQYDEITRKYDALLLKNSRIHSQRLREAYSRNPRLKELDESIASCSVKQAARLLDGDQDALNALKERLSGIRKERARLIQEMGLPENYFDPVYSCQDCRDTGYIHNKPCHCRKQAMIDLIYAQSNIRSILDRENFSRFSLSYYSNEIRNPATGLTARETAEHALSEARRFVRDFDCKHQNLFLYGDTGVGKTFLSNCIAKELLDLGYSVIYFTAFQLFDILGKSVFDKDTDALAANRNIFDCDLLIIDDLGTEVSSSFTSSQLFLCINERMLQSKSTIISTNLNMNQLADLYSERTLSRISSNYTIIKLIGEDIRIKQRHMR